MDAMPESMSKILASSYVVFSTMKAPLLLTTKRPFAQLVALFVTDQMDFYWIWQAEDVQDRIQLTLWSYSQDTYPIP